MLASALHLVLETNRDLGVGEAGPGAVVERFEPPVPTAR